VPRRDSPLSARVPLVHFATGKRSTPYPSGMPPRVLSHWTATRAGFWRWDDG